MCGITGFVQPGLSDAEQIIAQMSGAITHRGPDDSGHWADPENGVVFGFRRLSILDLSEAGHQPMISSSGRFAIIFNGEIYNYLDFRQELQTKSVNFKGHSDTEAILAAFEEWGVQAALKRFNGMYAFALWDKRERFLHLCRDRLGEKPLYYGVFDGKLLFASEAKALLAHPLVKSELDLDALRHYLSFDYVPAPMSIYKGISKLPAAHLLTVENGEIKTELLGVRSRTPNIQSRFGIPVAAGDCRDWFVKQ